MKFLKILAALAALGLSHSAFAAALTSNCIWSLIGTGNTLYGGMFDPSQTAGMATDLASTSSSSATPNFSSSTYGNFTNAALVGDWVFVGAGSGWQTGFYKITAVGSNVITVDAAIGHVILYNTTTGAFSLSTVAGCGATTGGTWAIDYAGPSQATDLFTDSTFTGAGTAVISNTSSVFDVSMVGNAIHLTAGTGATVGWYTITGYTSATAVSVNVSPGTGTVWTGYVGGANALYDNINSATAGLGPVAGNTVWFQGSFTEGATATTWAVAGTNALPMHWAGYLTYWGDGYLGRGGNNFGALNTTNMATLAYSSTGRFSAAAFMLFENLNVTSAVAGVTFAASSNNILKSCAISNSSVNASANCLSLAAETLAFDCDITESSTTLATTCASTPSGQSVFFGCRIISDSTNAAAVGLALGSSDEALFNQVFMGAGVSAAGGLGIHTNAASAACLIAFNTVVGGVDDVNILTGTTNLNFVIGNMLTDCTNPVNAVSASNAVFLAYNRYRQNVSGGTNTIANGGPWTVIANYAPIISGTSATDYQNLANDLRLLTGSPAAGKALPVSASMGANQLLGTGGGEVDSSYAK